MIASISLAQSNLKNFVQLGGNNANHACMAPSDFPQLSPDACASYIRFHSRRMGVELDDTLMDVCNQIQGVLLSAIAALTHCAHRRGACLLHCRQPVLRALLRHVYVLR